MYFIAVLEKLPAIWQSLTSGFNSFMSFFLTAVFDNDL